MLCDFIRFPLILQLAEGYGGWLLHVVPLLFPLSAEVLKIVVDDTIQPITDEYIGRAIQDAARNNDQALLIEMSTPGGLVDSTRDIIEKILASPVPVIIYVAPSGSRAASAGFFILESADMAAMAPGTNTGAAHPVTLGGGKMDDVMKEKVENDAAAFMRSVVVQARPQRGGGRERGAPVEIVHRSGSALAEADRLRGAQTKRTCSSRLPASRSKRFDGKTVTLNLVGPAGAQFDMTLKQHILDYLMDPNIAFRPARHRGVGPVRRVQSSRSGGAGNGGCDFHPAGGYSRSTCCPYVSPPWG